MKCPSCDAEFHGRYCACGYATRPSGKPAPARAEPSLTPVTVIPEVSEREAEIRRFAAEYMRDNPSATYREACCAYLAKHSPKGADMLKKIFSPRTSWNDDYFEGKR